jgi:glucose-1-phosphate thymidylyltransferase
MKGLILAGGSGSRLRPLTSTQSKQLVPIANRPILEYTIGHLAISGIKEIGVIISPETGEEIKEVIGYGARWGVSLNYIVQDRPAGLAHAVKTAEYFLRSDPFIMYLGDNLLYHSLESMITTHANQVLLSEVEEPSRFGVARFEGEKLVGLVEKPKNPPSNLALVGVYRFNPVIFEAVHAIKPSARGELEITDAIQWLLDKGHPVGYEIVKGWWKDTGSPQSLLEANLYVLNNKRGQESSEKNFQGLVWHQTLSLGENVTVRGPAIFGDNVHLENCYIGPYTSIGENCRIIGAQIENSIVMAGSVLYKLDKRLEGSIIGKGVVISSEGKLPGTSC